MQFGPPPSAKSKAQVETARGGASHLLLTNFCRTLLTGAPGAGRAKTLVTVLPSQRNWSCSGSGFRRAAAFQLGEAQLFPAPP